MTDKQVSWKIHYNSGNDFVNNDFCEAFIRSYPDFEKVYQTGTNKCWLETAKDNQDELSTLDVILRLRKFMSDNPPYKDAMTTLKINSEMVIKEESDLTQMIREC